MLTKSVELENWALTPNSRSYLNRWAQPDSIIPLKSQGVQVWDRHAIVNNNPLRFTDPTGHSLACGVTREDCGGGGDVTDEERSKLLREFREEDNNQKPEVPFDASLGGNVEGYETSLLNNDAEKNNVNLGKVVLGITLIIGGGLMFIGGTQATILALSNPHLAIEFAPFTALVAVAGGSFVFIGIYTLINAELIPETNLNR